MDIVEQYGWIIGGALPWIQLHMNQFITSDYKIGKLSITITEQRIILTFVLSFLVSLALTLVSGHFSTDDLKTTGALVFATSQALYYGYFRKLKNN